MVLSLLVATSGLAFALETSGNAEMDVTILPAGGDKRPVEEQSTSTLAGDHNVRPGPVRAGTVTARIVFVDRQDSTSSGGSRSAVTTIVVSDDRGTAMGWEVLVSAQATQPAWRPVLVRNQPDTISRVSPVGKGRGAPDVNLANGQSLGPLAEPARVLQAWPGSGDGLFVQQLAITYPALLAGATGTLYIHLPFAP